jgi:hypothetical protein
VDLLIVDGPRILPIEIKCGAALDPRALADLRQCMQDLSLTRGFVGSTSSERRSIGKGMDVRITRFSSPGDSPSDRDVFMVEIGSPGR